MERVKEIRFNQTRQRQPDTVLDGQSLESVRKDSGAEINIGVFNEPTHSAISAVVFATAGSWGKVRALASDTDAWTFFDAVYYNPDSVQPTVTRAKKCDYTESLLDGLRVYHNPHADVPLDRMVFRAPEVFQTYFDHNADDWVYEASSRNLMFRSVTTLLPDDS